MELTIIGCSGSFPGPTSPASCYLLKAQAAGRQWHVLMDLGSGALGPMQNYVNIHELDAVLLTHLHPDHFLDLCGLVVARHWDPQNVAHPPLWDSQNVTHPPLPVWGPAATQGSLVAALGSESEPVLSEVFSFHPWLPRKPVTVGPLTITPYCVLHPIEEAYALRVEYRNTAGFSQVLTYSGDTDLCPGLTDAAHGADLFLCEASFEEGRDDHVRNVHLTGKRAGEAASAAEVSRVVLTHIPPWTNRETVLAETQRALATAGKSNIPVSLAVPGATYLGEGEGRAPASPLS